MTISVQCPECGAKLKAPAKLAGKKAKCKCGNVVAVPGAAPRATAAAPSAGDSGASPTQGGATAPRWRPMTSRICPNCQAKMEPGNVVCLECGFHTEKGIQIPLSPAAKAKAAAIAGKGTGRQTGAGVPVALTAAAPDVRRTWVKPTVIVAVLAVVGLAAYAIVARSGGSADQAALDSLRPGMTVEHVVKIAGTPLEVYAYHSNSSGGLLGGLSRPVRIDYKDSLMQSYGKERFREGFYFVYRTGAAQRQINFDDSGTMIAAVESPLPGPR